MSTETRKGRKAPPGGPRTRMFQMRMNDPEYDRLQAEARRRGMTAADLVRAQLGALLGRRSAPRLQTTENPSEPAKPLASTTTDLGAWLSEQTGMPLTIARRYIAAGRVTVDGAVHTSEFILSAKLDRVRLDGEPVQDLP